MHTFKDIKVGSIVTGYYAGYWKVLKVEDRSNQPYPDNVAKNVGKAHPDPVVHLEMVMDTKGNLPKKKAKQSVCDIAYCVPITREYADEEYKKTMTQASLIRNSLYKLIG